MTHGHNCNYTSDRKVIVVKVVQCLVIDIVIDTFRRKTLQLLLLCCYVILCYIMLCFVTLLSCVIAKEELGRRRHWLLLNVTIYDLKCPIM